MTRVALVTGVGRREGIAYAVIDVFGGFDGSGRVPHPCGRSGIAIGATSTTGIARGAGAVGIGSVGTGSVGGGSVGVGSVGGIVTMTAASEKTHRSPARHVGPAVPASECSA